MSATSSDAGLYDRLVDIVARNTGNDREDLEPDTPIRDLGVDSIAAAEILAQAEQAAGADIDIRRVPDDWSALTVRELVRMLTGAFVPQPSDD